MTDQRAVAWVTYVLVALNLAMFVVELALGVTAIRPQLLDALHAGANFAPKTLGAHQWWRLATSMFMHFGVVHLVENMIALWLVRRVERIYGHAAFATIYVLAGVFGGIVSLVHGPHLVAAGASGAVFGVFGALAVYLLLRRADLEPARWRRSVAILTIVVVGSTAIGSAVPGTDIAAHAGGFVTGIVTGIVLLPGGRALATAAAGLALAIATLLVVPPPPDLIGVAASFRETEHECVTLFNIYVHRDPLELADALDRDILPSWHAARERLEAVADDRVSPKLRPLLVALRSYAKDREEAWRELARATHAHEPLATYKQLAARVDADIREVDEANRKILGY